MSVIKAMLQPTTKLAVLISMNVLFTTETALKFVSTRKVVTCVSAAQDITPLTLSKYCFFVTLFVFVCLLILFFSVHLYNPNLSANFVEVFIDRLCAHTCFFYRDKANSFPRH